ncbi:MAG: hypothetical protein M0Z30_12880 [Actinomycetota bacterium]|nr:hypothetical protein [Actinomycetota bacterium]
MVGAAGLVAGLLSAVVPSGVAGAAPGPASGPVGAGGLVSAQTVQGGYVFPYGAAPHLGSLSGDTLDSRTVAIASTPTGQGYWLVGADGGVFTFGDAAFEGSTGSVQLAQPVVGMAGGPAGKGYWLVASDGGVFSFGTSHFYGSTGGVPLVQPVMGMAAGPGGAGYWLVASDGGVFSYGSSRFYGSTGGVHLVQPIVGMAATPDGKGYWLVASDGGIFSFGDALFYGSTGGRALSAPIVGMAATPDGRGYYLVGRDGSVYTFGDAVFHGSASPVPAGSPAIGIAACAVGGYWVATRGPATSPFTPQLDAYIKTLPETVTAAVEDLNTGAVYTYDPGLSLVLGSTVKVQILGTLLAGAQAQHRWLTPTEISEATAMIEISDNADGQALFDEVGGAGPIQAWDDSIGMTDSYVFPNWGLSTSSALDELTLLKIYAEPNRFLSDPYRLFGLDLLRNVELSQIFGINVGPPESGVQAVKTGRIPEVGAHNAIGWIEADGRNYLIASLVQWGPSDPVEEAAIEPMSVDTWFGLGP